MYTRASLLWSRILARAGEGPCPEYRIPGIVVTERGTLLCCYEGRMSTHDDWAHIRTWVCRSDDDGETWQRRRFTLGDDTAVTINNPLLLTDGDLVHLIYHENTCRAFHCVSEDDGLTWSEPAEITEGIRELDYDWNVCAVGLGHGVRMADGTLAAPIWVAHGKPLDERRKEHHPSRCGAIYSTDRGATWHGGQLFDGICDGNETTIAELRDHRLLYNLRNCEPDMRRRLALSDDAGRTVRDLRAAEDLPDPWCFGGMVSLPDGTLLFANCATDGEGARKRVDLTVKQSVDDGANWRKLIEVDPIAGYADIAVYGEYLYVLYERTINGAVEELRLRKYRLT